MTTGTEEFKIRSWGNRFTVLFLWPRPVPLFLVLIVIPTILLATAEVSSTFRAGLWFPVGLIQLLLVYRALTVEAVFGPDGITARNIFRTHAIRYGQMRKITYATPYFGQLLLVVIGVRTRAKRTIPIVASLELLARRRERLAGRIGRFAPHVDEVDLGYYVEHGGLR